MASHRLAKFSQSVEAVEVQAPSQAILRFPLCAFFEGRVHLRLLSLISLLFLGILFMTFAFWVLGINPGESQTLRFLTESTAGPKDREAALLRRYLYWGTGIDCPGKHCVQCGGLGHQESSLRCALEEALFLNRTFVLPSRMCIGTKHNDLGILRHASHAKQEPRVEAHDCAMDDIYDLDLISHTVSVILEISTEWHTALALAALQGDTGLVHVQGVGRGDLRHSSSYHNALIINRTASNLAWFVECKNRQNRSALMLPYSFLPAMAAQPLRTAAEQIILQLGDYDAIHVRRGDKLKVRKDRFGVDRTAYAHLDQDTQPVAILRRIAPWIQEGRTVFIASNERKPSFFHPISSKYTVLQAVNFSGILVPVVHNNYQLFVVERLVLQGAQILVKTWKDDPTDLSLSDESKKGIHRWEPVVHTATI